MGYFKTHPAREFGFGIFLVSFVEKLTLLIIYKPVNKIDKPITLRALLDP